MELPKKFFVTGTDTDIGKTVICAILAAGLNAAYWKPVQTGILEGTDTDWLKRVTGLPDSHFFRERWRLSEPLSPHAAAEIEGVHIDLNDFILPETENFPHLIVEGAGGLMVPLNDKHYMIDLIRLLDLPVVLVARSGLGTINHTLLSLEQLRRYGIDIVGVVVNGPANKSNKDAIERYGRIPILAQVEPIEEFDAESLSNVYSTRFNQP